MPYYYYGFDWTYLVLVMPCILIAAIASARVNSTFRRYSKQISARRITGAEAARRVLAANGVYGVQIQQVAGNLTDHFDPKSNVIRLSGDVYGSCSTAARRLPPMCLRSNMQNIGGSAGFSGLAVVRCSRGLAGLGAKSSFSLP